MAVTERTNPSVIVTGFATQNLCLVGDSRTIDFDVFRCFDFWDEFLGLRTQGNIRRHSCQNNRFKNERFLVRLSGT